MRASFWIVAALASAALAGCGDSVTERAIYGASAGIIGAAVIDGDVGTGAAVGAAANVAYCEAYPARC